MKKDKNAALPSRLPCSYNSRRALVMVVHLPMVPLLSCNLRCFSLQVEITCFITGDVYERLNESLMLKSSNGGAIIPRNRKI